MVEPVVWARCATPAHAAAVAALDARLRADGEDVTFAVTHDPQPEGRRTVTAHLDRLSPMMMLWVGGALDAAVLATVTEAKVPVIVIDADASALDGFVNRWFPSRSRAILSRLRAVYTRDPMAAAAFVAAGAAPNRTHAVGLLEDPPAVLPHVEADRRALADILRSRPLWLATQAELGDVATLAAAQRHAARRSHRLLLAVTTAVPGAGSAFVAGFEALGLPASLRSESCAPDENVQVHVIDAAEEIGLWLRLATVTLAVGTLTQSAAQDPFEAAALGSVLIHGPRTAPFAERYDRLARAGATLQVDNAAGVGRAVEALLAADRVAAMAMAGWDVTSRGAEATDRIVTMIRQRLDEAGL
ncbi:3-deoxy-D-manno-octulosonic-acid transferase [Loktanella fryxellensis]|uniref:3-deoxy-D-manno-octulosonic acid transferase n=1 Tax=Loktanella fryxellensis TaxID=245187 RepID=A0A1H8HSX6_9RHOB|nr:hypothetical protein [Loktanella fryxellensis]SEN59380.1 3-deoxy-D-manno-octulosonic-acid transferase [Loktanella fryxellensis]